MHDYLLMVFANEAERAKIPPEQLKTLIDRHSVFAESLRASGAHRASERLRQVNEGKRVRLKNGAAAVESGPFAGEDRSLEGFYLLQAKGLDAAVSIAKECPALASDVLEVRPVMKGAVDAAMADKPGKVFAFAVLGSAPDERAWVHLMDRIDAETADRFKGDAAANPIGGVRLLEPSTGRRFRGGAGKPLIVDGPFAESKEVIGGVCFMRLPSIDAAVEWAKGTPFVAHGALEIRELWRT